MISVKGGVVPVALPYAEFAPLAAALLEVGLEAVHAEDAAALRSLVAVRTDVTMAIVGGDSIDDGLAMRDVLAEVDPSIAALIVIGEDELDAAIAAPSRVEVEDDWLVRPIDPQSVGWRAQAMIIRAQTADAETDGAIRTGLAPVASSWTPRAKLFVVFSPKGGVGKTTLATNLCATFQAGEVRRTLLVDADTVTGHVTTSLALDDVRTVADSWLDDTREGSGESLLDIAAIHESGLRVLALTNQPLRADALDPQRVLDAIEGLRTSAEVIVVDTRASYDALNLALFQAADRILVPVTPDVSAIKATMQFHDIAVELGVIDRVALVVNRADSGVPTRDIERTIGLPAIAEIRSSGRQVVSAANEGRTVVDRYPREKITADFRELAERLVPSLADAHARNGFRTMFARRAAIA